MNNNYKSEIEGIKNDSVFNNYNNFIISYNTIIDKIKGK